MRSRRFPTEAGSLFLHHAGPGKPPRSGGFIDDDPKRWGSLRFTAKTTWWGRLPGMPTVLLTGPIYRRVPIQPCAGTYTRRSAPASGSTS